jgi:hypothetical protein
MTVHDIAGMYRSAGKAVLAAFLIGGVLLAPLLANASDMPTAAGSPIAGITFDDRPLLLPEQRNFQMAMLTASSELGRSCSHIESYGWRMAPNEQQRVNQIFNNTVDRMRAQGFIVESKSPSTVAHDVTLFTADRPDKHLIFMWSAGEIGLVMVICETSPPLALPPSQVVPLRGQPGRKTSAFAAATNPYKASEKLTLTGKPVVEGFSPLGDWVGSYTCAQGTTGGALRITRLHGEQFEGEFRFYPTTKNPTVESGSYLVFGEYDRDSNRILINPGKWLKRPSGYYNTVMIGSFDPVAKTFSAYYQGITGCTSFEARYSKSSAEEESDLTKGHHKKAVKAKTKAKHKKAMIKKPVKAPEPEKTTTAPAAPSSEPAATPASPNADAQPKADVQPKPDAQPKADSQPKADVPPKADSQPKANTQPPASGDSISLPPLPPESVMRLPPGAPPANGTPPANK